MKTLITSIFFLAIMVAVRAQDIPQSEVPSVVVNTLQSKFAAAKDIKWKLKGDEYKGEFKVGTRGHDVWLDKSGTIRKHKEDFPKSDLPAPIKQQIEKEFSAYKIDDVDKVDAAGKITYQVDLEAAAGGAKKIVTFTPDGKVQKTKED